MVNPKQKYFPLIDLTTNISQIFTELYYRYHILTNPAKNVFEHSLYLENIQASTIIKRLNDDLISYHLDEGTLELYINPNESKKDQVFTAGCGSTQLYKGLVYAMATSFPDQKFLFVQKIPFFSGQESAVNNVFDYQNVRYQGYRNPKEVIHKPGTLIVEWVTSPNNPDGTFRKPETNPDIIIGDFVFTSSSFGLDGNGYIEENLKWLRQARKEGKCVFTYNSASKQFGHTSDRFGYMWFPLYNSFAKSIYSQFLNFIATTVGGCIAGAAHFLDLLPALIEEGKQIRQDANESLKIRMVKLSKALKKRYPGSRIDSLPGSPTLFAQIKDKRLKMGLTAEEIILEDTNVRVENGTSFGENDSYIRVNIMSFSEDLVRFIQRLLNRKVRHLQLLKVSCSSKFRGDSKIFICGTPKKTIQYIVNPNDQLIEVDASVGKVEIFLPKFLGYEPKQELKIKRIDCEEDHRVIVYSDFFKIKIHPHGFAKLLWKQPFYLNGQWKIKDLINADQKRYSFKNEKLDTRDHRYHPEVRKLFMV